MEITLRQVTAEEKEILRNLLEKYDYEFSQWDLRDVNRLGLYGYSYLDNYWTEPNRWAYFILADGQLAGFVMVNDYAEVPEPTDYALAEFFVMLKYRRMGVGRYAANWVFSHFHGRWQLKRHPRNLPAVAFWDSVIDGCTGGNYRLVRAYPGVDYDDGSPGDLFFFET